jgi:hypothetical protein
MQTAVALQPPGSEPATDSQLTVPEISELREKLVNAVMRRHEAAGGTEHFWLAAHTMLAHDLPPDAILQLFGSRDLGAHTGCQTSSGYKGRQVAAQRVTNGSKNAMMVSEDRSQYHVLLSVLLAMGYSTDDQLRVASLSATVRQALGEAHNANEMIDFASSFAPLPLAVDAATMLEAFHNFRRRAVPHRNDSRRARRQKAVFYLPTSGSATRVSAPG